MTLLELDSEYNIVVKPELFQIESFSKLNKSRKSPALLVKELGYIFFFYNMGSDFQFQTDEKERHKDVIKRTGLPDKWSPDKLLQECIKDYKHLSTTVSSKLLEGAYIIVDKTAKQMKDINLNERDKNGRPIWNLKQITSMTKDLPELFKSVSEAEKAYIKHQKETDALRGGKLKTLYEEGNLGSIEEMDLDD
jgi:hypothetical protein